MLTLFYGPGACSMASHIVLEESGEKYEPKRMDLAKGEQRSEEYLKMNPQGRVPLLQLDNGEPLAENTAILPYLGKRFKTWPSDAAEGSQGPVDDWLLRRQRASRARSCRPARALHRRNKSAYPGIKEQGLKTFHGYLKQIDEKLAGREWLGDSSSGARSLWLCVLHLGRAARTAYGRTEKLHGIQGPHDEASGRRQHVLEDEKIKV